MKWLAGALALCASFAIAVPASAAVREVPQDYPTIQDAVDASNPGDVIAISKKKNFQNVTVPTANLLIRGVKPGVVVDGYINGAGNGSHFDITANNVRLVNMELRNGDGVECNSTDRCTGKKLKFTGEGGSTCFDTGGNQVKLLQSVLRSCGSYGIYASGDDAVVRGNTFLRTDSACVYVSGGDDAVVSGNRLAGCEDGDGIYINGDRALVEGNSAWNPDGSVVEVSGDGARVLGNRGGNTYSECFYVNGDRAKVRNNRGTGCHDDGLDVSGEDPQVTGNRIDGTDGYLLDLSCSTSCGDLEVVDNVLKNSGNDDYGMYASVSSGTGSAVFARNVVSGAAAEAFYFSGVDDARITGNAARASGYEDEESFYLSSADRNVVANNRAIDNGGDGFYVSGSENRLEDNLAKLNSGDGFEINSADNVLLRNLARQNRADGIENNGTDTVLRKNEASGSHRDCANDGTIAVKQGNKCADGSNFNEPGTASRVKH